MKIDNTYGMVFDLGSTAISWGSKKQDVTALSTTEAEYKAATAATCQGIWLKRLMKDCGMKQGVVEIWCDNRSTIEIAKNPAHHERTKHRYSFPFYSEHGGRRIDNTETLLI